MDQVLSFTKRLRLYKEMFEESYEGLKMQTLQLTSHVTYIKAQDMSQTFIKKYQSDLEKLRIDCEFYLLITEKISPITRKRVEKILSMISHLQSKLLLFQLDFS